MNNHTKEPWLIDENNIHIGSIATLHGDDAGYSEIWSEWDGSPKSHKDNARRIVACVNACRGLATDDLEQRGLISAVGSELLSADRQRDKLLAALKDCVESLKVHNPYWDTDWDTRQYNIVVFAEKIISEVEGKNDLS